MAENHERNVGTTKLGEGFVWKTKKPEKMIDDKWVELEMKIVSTIRLCLTDELMYDVMDEVNYCYMVEVEEPIYVQVPQK